MKKLLTIVLVLTMAAVLFAGCTKTDDSTESVTDEATTAPIQENTRDEEVTAISGDVTVSGSTSVEKIGNALGDEFMALNPEVNFTYQGIGSSGGVKNANEGVTMLGTASRNIKAEEREWGMTEVVLAYDGIAVIVNPANTAVSDLTMEQVQKIYLGEITNWSQVGGGDVDIVVVSREDGSGTRGAFEELVEYEDQLVATALIMEGNGAVQAAVAGDADAIGYVSFTYIDDTVKSVKINGVEPTVENVLGATYPISRPFNIVYHEANLSDAAKAFLEFITTGDAKEIIEEKGGIPLE